MATTKEELGAQQDEFASEFDKEQEPAPVETHEPVAVEHPAEDPVADEAPLSHADAVAQYADAHKELDAPAPKKQTFKEAFAENRKAGNKTFEWEGKKFTTELAGEKKPAAPHSGASQADVRAAEPAAKPSVASSTAAPSKPTVSHPGDSFKPLNMHDRDLRGERMDLGKKA